MAGAGNNGGGSNGGNGASAGATQGAAGEGSVEGVGGDGTTDWKADPCPEPLGLCSAGSLYNAWDCAGDCKAVCKGSCLVDKDSACSFKDGPGALGDLHGKEVPPYTTRRMAPAAPYAGLCSCPGGKAVVVRWLAGAWNSHPTHIWVNRPWHIGPPRADTCTPTARAQCLDLPTEAPEISEALEDFTFQVWTDDANAPAANVNIGPGWCSP